MILNLVLIGLAVALDPLPLTAFLVVLPSRRGVRKGAAFVFGWLVSLAAVVTITVLATGNPIRTRLRITAVPPPSHGPRCLHRISSSSRARRTASPRWATASLR